MPEDGVAGGNDAEDFFSGLEVLVVGKELEKFHLPIDRGFEDIFLFPGFDIVHQVIVGRE